MIGKILANISSFYWILFFYFLHNQYFILDYCKNDKYASVILYLLFGLLLGWYSLTYMIKKSYEKTKDDLSIEKIYPVYTEYMPIYLAIIVIAFELNNFPDIQSQFTISLIFFLIYILFHISNIGYLNPIWYFIGYRVYKIENKQSNYIFIAHKNINYKSEIRISDIRKVDEFTFIKKKD